MRVSSPSRTGNASAARAASAALRSSARCGSDRSRRSSGCSSSQSCARTTAMGRPTSPATCSLPRPAKVSTVHSVVSIARSAAVERGLGGWRRRVAVLHVGGDEPGGQPAERELPPERPNWRAGVGRARAAGAISHTTRPPIGSWDSSPTRAAGPVEQLERLVEVVGEQEAGEGVDGAGGVDLVDAGLGGLGSPTGVDQAEHPPGRPGQAGPEAQGGRRVGDLVADRHRGRRREGEIERAAEGVQQPSRRHADRACRQQLGGPTGAGGTNVPSADRMRWKPSRASTPSNAPDAVEGGGHQIEVLDRAGQVGQGLLDVVGHVAHPAGRLLDGHPRRPGSRARPRPSCGRRRS